MNKKIDFSDLNFDKFSELAKDKSLSKYEKIGFPNAYREGYEEQIFQDINDKLTNLSLESKTVLDIGPGCSELPLMLIEKCKSNKHNLYLVDSKEMLNELPNQQYIKKIVGKFPNCYAEIKDLAEKVDVILCYSVFHYIFSEGSLYQFLDKALMLLAPGGQLFIGDIPNISKRKRFFSSQTGIQFHKKFMGTKKSPSVFFNNIEENQIDDAIITSIIMRSRLQGFNAYILPQKAQLPMANRREDILIERP